MDGSMDVVLAQNTITCLRGWLVRRTGLFESVEASRVDLGFYVLAKR